MLSLIMTVDEGSLDETVTVVSSSLIVLFHSANHTSWKFKQKKEWKYNAFGILCWVDSNTIIGETDTSFGKRVGCDLSALLQDEVDGFSWLGNMGSSLIPFHPGCTCGERILPSWWWILYLESQVVLTVFMTLEVYKLVTFTGCILKESFGDHGILIRFLSSAKRSISIDLFFLE